MRRRYRGNRCRQGRGCVSDHGFNVGCFADWMSSHRLEKKSRRLQPWMIVDPLSSGQTMSGSLTLAAQEVCKRIFLTSDSRISRSNSASPATSDPTSFAPRWRWPAGLAKDTAKSSARQEESGERGAAEWDSERVVLRAGVVLTQENSELLLRSRKKRIDALVSSLVDGEEPSRGGLWSRRRKKIRVPRRHVMEFLMYAAETALWPHEEPALVRFLLRLIRLIYSLIFFSREITAS